MPDDPLHQPHDKLFIGTFRDPANAAPFLQSIFPPTLARAINWAGLRNEPGSFIDPAYVHTESDLLFTAPFPEGRTGLLYILFEHQRRKDPWIPFRLLRYMTAIWARHLEAHPETTRLPVILPVVLAQNATTWKLPAGFKHLLDIPPHLAADLEAFVPDFFHRLVQLAEMPFDKITGTPAGILALRLLKAEQMDALLDDAVWDRGLLVRVSRDALELFLRYILGAGIDKEAFARRIEALEEPEAKAVAMTLADQFRQEGQEKGLQEGWLKGRQEGWQEGQEKGRQQALAQAVLKTLEVRFGRVPEGLKEAVQEIGADKLGTLLQTALQAASLEEFAAAM